MRRARPSSCAPVAEPWLTSTSACDAAGEVEQLGAARLSVVDQHQCVRRGHTGITFAESLPAAGVDQPCRRQFPARVVIAAEHGQGGMRGFQGLGLRRRHDRVLEEAAGVAEHRGIGQLAPADAADGFGDLRRPHAVERGGVDAHGKQLIGKTGVIQPELQAAAEFELDGDDDITVRGALEDAVAIGECAVAACQADDFAAHAVEGFDDVDVLAHLDAIGADVLDGRGADGTGDQGEVLESRESVSQRPQHQRMPLDAGIGADDRTPAIVLDEADVLATERQHRRCRITGEQQVAAAAKHEHRAIAQHRVAEQFRQRRGVRHFDQHRRARGNAKGVACIQPRVLDDPVASHACRRQSWGGTLPRLGASLRRRIASTHSPTSTGPR